MPWFGLVWFRSSFLRTWTKPVRKIAPPGQTRTKPCLKPNQTMNRFAHGLVLVWTGLNLFFLVGGGCSLHVITNNMVLFNLRMVKFTKDTQASSCHCWRSSQPNPLFSSFFSSLCSNISAFTIWTAPRCSNNRWFWSSVSVCFAPENALSHGTEDAGMERMSFAILLSIGYADPLSYTTKS